MAAVALVAAPVAIAKSYTLPAAHISARVTSSGAVVVTERLTFDFFGDFTGAYRDIPIREGETIDHIGVAEGDTLYAPGASAELGSSGSPGTYGTKRLSDRMRIVWHFDAPSDLRTFTVAYRIQGLAVAYDDVVDVNLKVWGDQWPVGLTELHASTFLPRRTVLGPSYRVWGAPEFVRGAVGRTPTHTKLLAVDIPQQQFVEMRTVFPRRLLTSTSGAKVVHGNGLEKIIDDQRDSAASFESDRRNIQDAKDHPSRTILMLAALGIGPAALLMLLVWFLFGRERKTTYDREYEQDPPSDLEPALVPPLLRQTSGVGSNEFTATLFDLIRRGRYKATPVTTEKSTFAGLHKQDVADLEIAKGNGAKLTSFEDDVADVVDSIVSDKPERLSKFRDRITEDRTENAKRFASFRKAVGTSIDKRQWFDNRGAVILGIGIAVFALLAIVLLWVGISGFRPVAPRWSDIVLIALGGCAVVNGVLLIFGGRLRAHVAAPPAEGRGRGGALGCFPPLPDRLPAAEGGSAGNARAVGALPRLRHCVRDRGTRPARRAAAYARGAAQPEHDLLDQPHGRPRVRTQCARDQRPQRRLRLRPDPSVLERLQRLRRRLLGRRWWRRRRRWRRRLVATGAPARRARSHRRLRRSATRRPRPAGSKPPLRRRPRRRPAVPFAPRRGRS